MEDWNGYSCYLEDAVEQQVSYMQPDPPQYLENNNISNSTNNMH